MNTILALYIEIIAKLIRRISVTFGINNITFTLFEKPSQTVDERIEKIDLAKRNLLDVINAIDELKEEAEANKKESAIALQQISELEKNRENLREEIDAIKTVIQSDVKSFQRVAGIPNRNTERIIGFISGLIAGIMASAIVYGIVKLVEGFVT